MSVFQRPYGVASLKVFCTLFVLLVFFSPRLSHANPLFLFYKGDAGSVISWQHATPKNSKQPVIAHLNENGDLQIEYGSMNVVVAYCPPEDSHKQQQPVHVAKSLYQEVPSMAGISISLNFTF